MKRTLLQLTALVAAFFSLLPASVSAQTQDNALYVYRNDGNFTAFLREDIDSIVLSHLDADSVWQQEFVMQEFHTPDSVYRIPISAIDSVSLVQPEIKYQDNVLLLESQHLPYIVEVSDSTITFLPSTPEDLLPSVGTVLAAMVFDSPLDNGFAGRVESMENDNGNLLFVCSEVNIGDIYKRIVYTAKFQTYANEDSVSLARRNAKAITRSSGSFDPVYLGEITAEAGPVSVSAEPTLWGYYTINHEENLKTHIALLLNADIATEVSLSAKIENPNNDPQIVWCKNEIRIPTNVPGLTGFIKGGAFFKVSASADISAKWPGRLYGRIGFTKGDDGVNKINTLCYKTGQTECSVNMNGEIDAGLCVRMGLAVIHDELLSLHVTGYGGLYAKADFSLTSEGLADGSLYSALKDSQLEVGYYFSGEPGYSILGEDKKFIVPGTSDTEFSIGLERREELAKWYLLPEFSQPEYTAGASNSTAVITTNPSRDLLMPVSLGIGLENEDGETVETKWNSVEYQKETEWTLNGESESFSDLAAGTYTAYPYVRILGQELRSEPSCEFEIATTCPDNNHVHLIDLGLPSGTKWACCNVGASSPEDYGGYYAWGETEEKSEYDSDTYAYYSSSDGWINIGSDIAGTSYDVAHVKWGGSYHMPTLTQIKELESECTWTWTTQNGVNGQLVTGSNGKSIFLPAAGSRDGTSLLSAGSDGGYWSSTACEDASSYAYGLYFFSGGYYCGCGLSVRPVSE